MNLIDLKERIVIASQVDLGGEPARFTKEERDFLLRAINASVEAWQNRHGGAETHNPPNNVFRIDHLWAALSVDEGGEGLCAAPLTPGMLTVPLIAADIARLANIKSVARLMAKQFGKHIAIVKFTKREEVEIMTP